MLLSEKQHQQYHYYLLMLFAFFLPLFTRVAVLILVVALVNWLAGGRIRITKWTYFFSAFFLIYLLSYCFSEHNIEGLRNLETKMTFLLFPLLMGSRPTLDKHSRENILKAFIAGCLATALVSLIIASWVFLQTGTNTFFYSYLSSHVGAHPTYLALYFSFALFLLLEKVYKQRTKKRWGLLALSAFFFFYIFLLAARMQILILVLLLGVAFLWLMIQQKAILKGVIILLLALSVCFSMAWSIPYTQMRIKVAYQEWQGTERSENIRMPIWRAGLELFDHNKWMGVGVGDVQQALNEIYKRDGINRALDHNYNIHNQYLQTAAATGWLGLLMLLLILIVPLLINWQRHQYHYLFFISLIILSMLTESLFETEKGVLFYTFVNSFLFFQTIEK